MKRETFITCLQALLSESDDELLREAEGLVFWRRRELRAAAIQLMAPLIGRPIRYFAKDGKTVREGTLDHLNKYSVTVKNDDPIQGYIATVVPLERLFTRIYHPMKGGAREASDAPNLPLVDEESYLQLVNRDIRTQELKDDDILGKLGEEG